MSFMMILIFNNVFIKMSFMMIMIIMIVLIKMSFMMIIMFELLDVTFIPEIDWLQFMSRGV